ncbi:MucR family transcriptional regulator [Caulobacter sp. KR2-114]|uniref:MucR family transcriptional regulator n=1 Tax=Caulobacter sp. KR2-114 TaxID=3400912 RepID=UPI003BFD9600
MAEDPRLIALTADIVAAYVEGNRIAVDDLPAFIREVHASLANPDGQQDAVEQATKLTPAQIRRSVTAAGIVSFEDGKTYQALKRHLTTRAMTVEQYKAKWGLPKDYPTTAPAYAARRSELAKAAGLGSKKRSAEPTSKPKTRGKKS